jgi:hypothetical protein
VADGAIQAGDKEVVSCPTCGGSVPPSRGFKPRKYCSSRCRRDSYRTPVERPKSCEQCGVALPGIRAKGPPRRLCRPCLKTRRGKTRPFATKCLRCGRQFTTRYKKMFCSDDCRYYNAKVRKGTIVSCKGCGKDFELRGHEQVYCSRECKCSASRTGVRDPRPCLRCGKEFSPGPYRNSGKFCSRDCAAMARREGHPRAREPGAARGGGRSIKARCEFYGAPYVPISKAEIFERFAWTCQICGCGLLRSQARTEEGKIDPRSPTVDHIVPVSLGPETPGHVWGNVQAACRRCNVAKGASLPRDSLAAG